jgi:hypothetical protein
LQDVLGSRPLIGECNFVVVLAVSGDQNHLIAATQTEIVHTNNARRVLTYSVLAYWPHHQTMSLTLIEKGSEKPKSGENSLSWS